MRGARLFFLAVCFAAAVVWYPLCAGAQDQRRDAQSETGDFLDTPTLPSRPEIGEEFLAPPAPDTAAPDDESFRIDYGETVDIENEIGVSQGRTRAEYQNFSLEADRMVIDYIAGRVFAEGNVVFRGPERLIKADQGRFDFIRNEGVAFGVEGQSELYYFRVTWDEEEKGPGFRQIDKNQSIFQGTDFTTSNFPVPMYYITASEVILLQDQRLYFRNPVLFVRGVPVFWLPAYTRSLEGGSPWSFEIGVSSEVGAFSRIGYRYIHEVQTPDWDDPEEYEARSRGQLDTALDLWSGRGVGVGAKYSYQFDYHRHIGQLQVYGIRDTNRNTQDTSSDGVTTSQDDITASDDERWVYYHRHNSYLGREVYLQAEIDEMSDPDVYYDFLDRFSLVPGAERGRVFTRSSHLALTKWHSDWTARAMVDQRHRLGRDRYTNPTNSSDDDLDYDPDPIFSDDNEFQGDGIPGDRFGKVTERAQASFATRLLRLRAPIYFNAEVNAFDALDPGFNTLDFGDDTDVRGVEGYAALTHRLRIGRRTSWVNTLGVGSGAYSREDDNLVAESDFVRAIPDIDGVRRIDGLRVTDRETFIVGGEQTRSLDGREPFYSYGEYRSRLNHRFADFLDGNIQYHYREGTENSLQEFYEQAGYIAEARNDIYDFPYDYHWVNARLNYFLRYPNISWSVYGGLNLQPDDEIYANERANRAGTAVSYANRSNEFRTSTGINYSTTQRRDPSDPNEFRQGTYNPYIRASYFPRHSRYWASLAISSSIQAEEDPQDRDVRQRRRFDEDESEVLITPLVGRQFGPKYRVQLTGTYNTRFRWWDNVGLVVLRDLHDAELGLFFGFKVDDFEDRRDDSDTREDEDLPVEYEYEIRGSIRFKIDRDTPGYGARSITTLSDLEREGVYVQ